METNRKGKAIIGIAMIVAVLASAVGVVSAADAPFTVVFEDQGYTVRIVFPNGEGIKYDGVQSEELRDVCDINRVLVHISDTQTVNVRIEVDGVSPAELSLSHWRSCTSYPFFMPVNADEINEFTLRVIDFRCADIPYRSFHKIYKITISEENKPYYEIYFVLVQGEDCNTYCENLLDHGIWDGESEYPNCGCICEKGWEMTVDGCVACDDICKEKGEHYIYDPENSYKNACVCKCEDGYKHSYYNDTCEKVKCPPNSTNVADLAGSCPKDRKLNRHCCCNESYIRSWGTCVREDSGEEDYYIKPVVHEIIVGEKIEFSLVKIKHGRDTTVSNDKIAWVCAL